MKTTLTLFAAAFALFGFAGTVSAGEHCQKAKSDCCKHEAAKPHCAMHAAHATPRSRSIFGFNGLGYPVRLKSADKGCCKHAAAHAHAAKSSCCKKAAPVSHCAPAKKKANAHCCAM